jgi:aldose 1-epimerase
MSKIPFQFCCTDSDGKEIGLYTLRNDKGTEVSITNYGAIISSLRVKMPDGKFNDIVLGFDAVEYYMTAEYMANNPKFGAAIGRYANRIKDAAFYIDGKLFYLTKNSGEDQLHGGLRGFDTRTWEYADSGDSTIPFLILKYTSIDGEEGFPGNVTVHIRFELNNENELSYAFSATTDAPTAINLTHHSYFNLNNGKGNIDDYLLKINANFILEQDAGLVTTGNIQSVKNTPFDFNEFTRIGDGLKEVPEYDKSYQVNKQKGLPVAEVKLADDSIKLQVYCTDPVVHFYTGKWIPVLKGKNGITYGAFSGLCLETQIHPNAINIPAFPNTVLRPGETYTSKTTYKIIT